MRSYTELRAELRQMADEENALRQKLIELQMKKNEAITMLVQAAEKLLMAEADEKNPGNVVRRMKYKTESPSPDEIATFTDPPSRCCSNCGEPGHNAKTCTNKRVEPEQKEKKKRKPLTEEQRKAKIEILKKARAAKRKKK